MRKSTGLPIRKELEALYKLCDDKNDSTFAIELRRGLAIHMKIDTQDERGKTLILAISRGKNKDGEVVMPSLQEWATVKSSFQFPFRLPSVTYEETIKDGRGWIKAEYQFAELNLENIEISFENPTE
jgi:hypothetical protein